jgi:hypothetical protein
MSAPASGLSPPFRLRGFGRDEERCGGEGEGDVGVPGVVASYLVVVQADLVLRGLERFLDRPPGSGDPDEFPQPGFAFAVAHVVGDLGRD